MSRSSMSVPPEAIRIEDEVWQEAFRRREPSRSRAAHRLRAMEDLRSARPVATPVAEPHPVAAAPRVTLPDAPSTSVSYPDGPAGPRVVHIRGRGAEGNLPMTETSHRRPARRAYERTGFRPDRVAMWAVFLGVLLLLVAILSAHG